MPTNPNLDLMRIFDFTAADLEANRAGHITEHQVQHLSETVKKKRSFLIFAAIALPAWPFLIVGMSSICNISPPITFPPVPLLLMLLSIPVLILFVIYDHDQKLASDVKAGTAYYEQGTIKRWSTKDGVTIKIANLRLDIEQSQDGDLKTHLKKVPKGTQFRVYYVPVSKKTVSIEVVEE